MTITTSVTIAGNLTRDPELRFTPNGTPVASFGVAVNRRRPAGDGKWEDLPTEFYSVTCWRDLAQNVAASLEKGTRVLVAGRLTHRTWETDQGDKRSAVEIVAEACGPELSWATADVHRSRRRSDQPPHPAEEETF